MHVVEIIGYLAGILTLITYVPQAVKTLRTRRTEDLSLLTYVILAVSALLWTVYGLATRQPAIGITNVIVFATSGLILVVKLRGSSDRA